MPLPEGRDGGATWGGAMCVCQAHHGGAVSDTWRGAVSDTWGGAAAKTPHCYWRGRASFHVEENRVGCIGKERCSAENACELG